MSASRIVVGREGEGGGGEGGGGEGGGGAFDVASSDTQGVGVKMRVGVDIVGEVVGTVGVVGMEGGGEGV